MATDKITKPCKRDDLPDPSEYVDTIKQIFRANALKDIPFTSYLPNLLSDENLLLWPASISKHHAYPGGLIQHISQVVSAASSICFEANLAQKPLNTEVVLLGALFHDIGKIKDYEMFEIDGDGNVRKLAKAKDATGMIFWKKGNHFKMVHHLVESYNIWNRVGVSEHKDAVSHTILAHHGRLEWGSPVLPATREAWAVHLADQISVNCIEERWRQDEHRDI